MSENATVWRLDVDQQEDHTLLRAAGDLDLVSAPQFLTDAEPYLADGLGGLVIDLRRLTFIDSSGLSALIRMNQRMSGTGRRFEIIPPAPPVAKAFEITGLDQVLPLRAPA